MKKISVPVIFSLSLLFFTGCKKDSITAETSIQGLWELRQASGMLTINYAPGNGNTINFSGNQYQIATNGQITESGRFEIEKDLTAANETCLVIAEGQYNNRIILSNSISSSKKFIQVSGNKLNILAGCFALDAGSNMEYARQ